MLLRRSLAVMITSHGFSVYESRFEVSIGVNPVEGNCGYHVRVSPLTAYVCRQ